MKMSEEAKTVGEVIEFTEKRFVAIAPRFMSYDAEKGFAIQVLKNNGYLMKVAQESPQSLQQAITNVAAIGLSLNPAEKLAYLIPRNVKNGDKWESRVFLEPSYMGLCRLATNTGAIDWVQANTVYAEDSFVDNGPGSSPTHSYNAFSSDRGEFVGVYCVAKTSKGDFLTSLMTKEEIESVRDRSEAWKKGAGGPWATDFSEMAKKTVIRRAFKTWPGTNENQRMAEAVELSNQNEGFEPLVTSPDINQYTADQKGYFDQLIEANNASGMAAFRTTLEEGAFRSLYHSFPKGQKGKYQSVVDRLLADGLDTLKSTAEQIEAAAQSGDDMAAKELIGELAEDEMAFVGNLLSDEAVAYLRELAKEEV
jgi:recombination protein RecT